MTVAELIEKLRGAPPDRSICVWDDGDLADIIGLTINPEYVVVERR